MGVKLTMMAWLGATALGVVMGSTMAEAQEPPAGTPEEQGAWVAHQVEERERGDDLRMEMRMHLFDQRNRERERALTLIALHAHDGDGERSLLRFTYPNDIAGTGLLVHEHPDEDDERFLYLPALGRVRRIAGTEAQESFVGSDFTYEDISGRELEDYTYRLVDAPTGCQAWTGPDGTEHRVYTLDSQNRDPDARFPRVVSRIGCDNFVVVHAQIYNRRDEVQKVYDALRIDRVDGYWTALDMRMRDETEGTRTELIVEFVDYNTGVSPDQFSRRELERGRTP